MRPLVEENGMIVEHLPPKMGTPMKQLNMVTLNQLPFPANHLAPGELRCENASHVDVATVERAAGFGLMGNLWEPPKSMGTTKFVICYLCYTSNVVFCFDWVKGCRGDIPLENLDFWHHSATRWNPMVYIYMYLYIYIYIQMYYTYIIYIIWYRW